MASEENKNQIIISNTGGLIRRMDHHLELMNRVLGEIAERKTEIIATGNSFLGMLTGEEREWQIAPGVKMTFCWCPPGDFIMGSPETENERWNDDEDQVHVTLTKGFWMAKTEVTQAQWRAVMGKNPSHFKGDDLPVETVSWDDAQEFIKKVNGSGEIPEGGKVCLPTEAQWEYACRAGEKGPFSGGTLDQVAWYNENSGGKTHPVGTKKSNAWGLHDMHGNVWEWCADWYDDSLRGGTDPSGPSSGVYRVYRGGSWGGLAARCRAAYRLRYSPDFRYYYLGFRPALVPSEKQDK
jgi:formylglycine-generating enzyme required for sulfatase activity